MMGAQKTIVITGASDGIGAAASRQLATTNARLILVGRSPEKTRAVAAATGAEYHLADFTRLD
ncbi:SDR family NAD(P)-dependent oxidoreductase, partial [Bacillus subtilis]|uniref:SDR family NAD(P)-dependent oxidoreductase n=1 Tax=Bacillus subtilis TaxID=1423 RepID=UPI0039810664